LRGLVKNGTRLRLGYVELLENCLCRDVDGVRKATGLVGGTWKLVDGGAERENECVVIGRIISCDTEDLQQSESGHTLRTCVRVTHPVFDPKCF
jgi:hypothetical protein